MHRNPRRREQGHFLVNALIWITVAGLVMAIALPAADKIRGDRDTESIVDVAKRVEKACRRHYADTKKTAIEFSPSRSGQYTGPHFHQLSLRQPGSTWRGPYLERPLSSEMNAFGGAIYLQNDLGAAPANGFRFKGPEGPLSVGPGQFLVFYGVPEDAARRVDARYDGTLTEDAPDAWADSGRVEWDGTGNGALIIQLSLNPARGGSDD